MTPQEYLDEILLPTLREYEEQTESRRKAYLACIVTYHLADFLEKAGAEKPQKAVREKCTAAWQVIHAVAIGAKHHDNASNRNPVKFKAGSDHYRPPATAGALECGFSELGDAEGSIVIAADEDYYVVDVLPALRTVLRQFILLYGGDYLTEAALPLAQV